MIELLFLSLFASLAVGGLIGLLGDTDAEVADRIDDANLGDSVTLLDPSSVDLLEVAFSEDPLLAGGIDENGDNRLLELVIDDPSEISGTDGDDFIGLPDTGGNNDAAFAGAGNDVVLGTDSGDVIFGEDGDDLIFGRGGFDQIFGDSGNDTLSGGDGDDLLVGGAGSDVIYGGAGNDVIYDNDNILTFGDPGAADIIVAGEGDDAVIISDGVNLVSLGAGADHVTVYTQAVDNPSAVITDFNPQEDSLLLGVHAREVALPEGVNGVEITYRLREIETSLGLATLVEPAIADPSADPGIVAALGPLSVGHAVLLGVSPEDLLEAKIRVVLTGVGSNPNGAGGIEDVAAQMGAARL
jgi:Ca2+-binding RTX toxin-like protein